MYRKSSLALVAVVALGIALPSFAQDWSAANKEAVALYKKGDVEGAVAKAGEATAAYAKIENFKASSYLKLLKLRLDLLSLINNPEGDLEALREGIEVITSHEGAKSDRLFPLYQSIYYTFISMKGKNADAGKAIATLISFGENAYGGKDVKQAMVYVEIAKMVKASVNRKAGLPYLTTAQSIVSDHYSYGNGKRATVELEIGKFHMVDGKTKDAEAVYSNLLTNLENAEGDTSVPRKAALLFLANIYNLTKRKANLMNSLIKLSSLMSETEKTTAVIRSTPRFNSKTVKNAKMGIIKLKFNINNKGFMTGIKVLSKNGDKKFEKAVLKEAKLWRFVPKVENGKAVFSSGYEAEYSFKPSVGRR